MKFATVFAVLALVASLSAQAQDSDQAVAQERGTATPRASNLFDPQKMQTIQGEVVKVEKVTPRQGVGQGPGVHIIVKTERGTIPVHLGPSWFLEQKGMQIKPQDQVEVQGARVTLRDRESIIATQIKDGDKLVTLRDASGKPLWAGGPRRSSGPAGQAMSEAGQANSMDMGPQPGRQQMMMQQHHKMLAEMKSRDSQLQKEVTEMNQAEGPEKVQAMADVINQLVQDRKQTHQRMMDMQQRMMSRMQGTAGQQDNAAGAPGNSEDEQGQSGQQAGPEQ